MKTRRDYLMAMADRTLLQAQGYEAALDDLRKLATEYPHLALRLDEAGNEFETARDALARAAMNLAKAGQIAGGDEPLHPDAIARAEAAERRRLS